MLKSCFPARLPEPEEQGGQERVQLPGQDQLETFSQQEPAEEPVEEVYPGKLVLCLISVRTDLTR